MGVLLHQKYSGSFAVYLADDVEDAEDYLRGKVHGKFVQKQELGTDMRVRPIASIESCQEFCV